MSEKVPSSIPYKRYANEAREHARTIEAAVPEMFNPKFLGGEALTKDEQRDVNNFARYASRRLAAGALSSPMNHRRVKEDRPGIALEILSPEALSSHDLWHAAVQYEKTGGKSLVPAYMGAAEYADQFTNEESVDEEMVVDLLQTDGLGVGRNILEGTPIDAFFAKERMYFPEWLSKLDEGLQADGSKERDFFSYFMTMQRAMNVAVGEDLVRVNLKGEEREKALVRFEAMRERLLHKPSSQYKRIARGYYDSEQGEARNPKFSVHELQRMTAPLLSRLAYANENTDEAGPEKIAA